MKNPKIGEVIHKSTCRNCIGHIEFVSGVGWLHAVVMNPNNVCPEAKPRKGKI